MTLPSRQTFSASPATVTIRRDSGDEVWVGVQARWKSGDFVPYDLELTAHGDVKWFPLASLDEVAQGLWEGQASSDSPNGPKITVRPTVEEDAVSAVTLAGYLSIPMPLAVITEILESDVSGMPKLWAMSDDDGFVATMMLDSDAGLYVRYSGGWHRITDPDVVDGLTVTEVDDAALDMYDQFDRAGQMVALSAMYIGGKPVMAEILGEDEVATPVVAAPTESRAVPVLASAADLEAAIIGAEGDESLQWYVERRARALGLEAVFPWQQ